MSDKSNSVNAAAPTDNALSADLLATLELLRRLNADDASHARVFLWQKAGNTSITSSKPPVQAVDVPDQYLGNQDDLDNDEAVREAEAAFLAPTQRCHHGGVQGAASIKFGHPGCNGMNFRAAARSPSALGRLGVELPKHSRGSTPIDCMI